MLLWWFDTKKWRTQSLRHRSLNLSFLKGEKNPRPQGDDWDVIFAVNYASVHRHCYGKNDFFQGCLIIMTTWIASCFSRLIWHWILAHWKSYMYSLFNFNGTELYFQKLSPRLKTKARKSFLPRFSEKRSTWFGFELSVRALQYVTGGEIDCTTRLHGKQPAADFFLKNHAQRHPRYIYAWTWIGASKDTRRLKDPGEICVGWKFVALCWLWRHWMSSEPEWS